MVSMTLSIVVLTLISFFWKISAHAISISGAAGVYFALILQEEPSQLYVGLALSFALCGVVASARLKLIAHNTSQVWAGLLLGFLLNFIMILILNV